MNKGVYLFLLFSIFSTDFLFSQCLEPATCTVSLTGTTDYDANDPNAVICITGNYSGNLSLSNGATIIVEAGANWTIASNFIFDGSSVFNNGTINGDAAFVIGPSSVFLNSESGVLNIGGDLIFNSNWPNEGDQACTINNFGQINALYVESVNTYVENYGVINVTREMYIHGDFTNFATVNIVCPAGVVNCNLTTGDFTDGHNYSNEGGITTVNGAAYFDGNVDGSGRFECTNANEIVRFTASSGYNGSDVFAVAGNFDITAPMGSNDDDPTNDPTLEVLGEITTPTDCLGGADLVVNICPGFSPLSNTATCTNYLQSEATCANNLFKLPVELNRFYFEAQNKSLKFYWETSSEVNFSHFELEKSTSGSTFKFIESRNASNKSSGDNYSSQSYDLAKAEGYYRLKLIDRDGSYEYSNILYHNGNENPSQVFPNPVGDNGMINFTVENTSVVSVSLFELNGKKLKQLELEGEHSYSINILDGLDSGSYILIIENADFKRSQKIIY